MAEERTLGLARAPEQSTEELSKEELQRRMGVARDSISNTVTEIKETVANQVQAVKDTLDWREQYRRRPVAWSVGAFGIGFLVGCRVASAVSSDDDSRDYRDSRDYYGQDYRSYAAQPVLSHASASMKTQPSQPLQGGNGHADEKGPGLMEKLTHSPAYSRVKDEVGDIGNNLIQELTKTAKVMVVPAIIASLKKFLGDYLPEGNKSADEKSQQPSLSRSQPQNSARAQGGAGYQPALERNPELT
jgi:hypothetical protein